MAELKSQSFKNHARFDPPYHFFVLPVLLVNFFVCIVHDYHEPRHFNEWLILMSIVLIVLALKVRTYALKVQDRVVRLEERLRLASLCQGALGARISELTEDQLIGLRFASDAEVPGLVEKTLQGNLSRKDIKQAVQNWRGDFWRV
jgi:hypothetical protein